MHSTSSSSSEIVMNDIEILDCKTIDLDLSEDCMQVVNKILEFPPKSSLENSFELLDKLASEFAVEDATKYFEWRVNQARSDVLPIMRRILKSIKESSTFTQEQKNSMSVKVIAYMRAANSDAFDSLENIFMQKMKLNEKSKQVQYDEDMEPTPEGVVRPRVFVEFSSGESVLGRLEIELFIDIAPKTAENFRALCTGEKGSGPSGEVLHYKGTSVYANFSNCIAAGNTEKPAEKGLGSSIFGGLFEHETYSKQHFRGAVSMEGVARKDGVCGSSFVVCTQPIHWMDGNRVVFGKVINGLNEVADAIEIAWSGCNKCKNSIKVSDCGML